MSNSTILKKPALTAGDWHPADVVAAVWKSGTSLQKLSREHHLHSRSLAVALRKQWPNAERLIADRLGVHPHDIWPSRYDEHGNVQRLPALSGTHRTPREAPCNVKARKAT